MSAYTKKKSEVLLRKKHVEDFIIKRYIEHAKTKGVNIYEFAVRQIIRVKRLKTNELAIKAVHRGSIFSSVDEMKEIIFSDMHLELWHLGIDSFDERTDVFPNARSFIIKFL